MLRRSMTLTSVGHTIDQVEAPESAYFPAMAFNLATGHVILNPPAKTRPFNPLRETGPTTSESDEMELDSQISLSSSTAQRWQRKKSDRLLQQLFLTDQRSFVEGSSSVTAQAYHVLDALRLSRHGKKRAIEKAFKAAVVCIDGAFFMTMSS